MIMMMEKTTMPSGSSLRRPTGNLCCSLRILHCTSLCVVQMINVQSRSSAESTSEAMSESDEELKAAMILATRSRMLAMTLIYFAVNNQRLRVGCKAVTLIAHFAFLSPFLLFSLSSCGSRGSMSPPVFLSAPPSSATPSPSRS